MRGCRPCRTAAHRRFSVSRGAIAASRFDYRRRSRRRGFAIEPASATAVACALQKGKEAGEIAVVVATGAAVKWPETILGDFVEPARLPADFDSVEELLGGGESLEEPPSDA